MVKRNRDYSTLTFVSWGLYDWGHSSFSAIIQTFVFAAYFTSSVAENETLGAAQWGFANGIAGFIVALCAPILGAIADKGNCRKLWTFLFSYICIIATALLWFVEPNPNFAFFALVTVAVGIVGAEMAFVFYNALLPDIAPPRLIGRWSGWGWCCGYTGGLASLVLALFLFVKTNGIKPDESLHIRWTFILVAVWYAVFSLPFFLFIPKESSATLPAKDAVIEVLKTLRQKIKQLLQYRDILKFLIASMAYHDALITLFAFGGVYAATLFKMDSTQILTFGIALQITSAIGAAFFGILDDIMGSKKLIVISLSCTLLCILLILISNDITVFWGLGLTLGIFMGPIQSASRSYMARMAPQHLRNEMFGLYALSGKATAFLGPLLVGWVTYLTHSSKVGMSVVLIFLVTGLFLMYFVPEAKKEKK